MIEGRVGEPAQPCWGRVNADLRAGHVARPAAS
jgi:hypothetical protein